MSVAQKALRNFYSALLELCQDSSVQGNGYWGLKYFNRSDRFGDCPTDLYSFARFVDKSGRALVVVANFRPNSQTGGCIRIPPELVAAVGFNGSVDVRLRLDRGGKRDVLIASLSAEELKSKGFPVSIANQSAHVFLISPATS